MISPWKSKTTNAASTLGSEISKESKQWYYHCFVFGIFYCLFIYNRWLLYAMCNNNVITFQLKYIKWNKICMYLRENIKLNNSVDGRWMLQ